MPKTKKTSKPEKETKKKKLKVEVEVSEEKTPASKKRKKTPNKKISKKKTAIYTVETVAIVIIAIVMVALLLNKTFFKEEYESNDFKIPIPILYYFVKDEDGVIEFKTLRKSNYDIAYFDNYKASLDKYDCNGGNFYYDRKYKLAIYDIDISKNFAVKTVKIKYEIMDIKDACN